jgi:hypothetical protein
MVQNKRTNTDLLREGVRMYISSEDIFSMLPELLTYNSSWDEFVSSAEDLQDFFS